MEKDSSYYDAIVVGSGMGGMSSACLLSSEGLRVLVLEAAHVPGGCSSSYKRKGYVFESGATTLIGFDKHQPLRWLEDKLEITLEKWEIQPSMAVHASDHKITRYKNQPEWIREVYRVFGNRQSQQRFWQLAWEVSDKIWRLSGLNNYFPPTNLRDLFSMVKLENIKNIPLLRFAFRSVADVARDYHIYQGLFKPFLDEQLIITAQSTAEDTPFLFGAPALTYTNSSNYYVPGGLLNMIRQLENYLTDHGGELHCKEAVLGISQTSDMYRIKTEKSEYRTPTVISNLPVWNMSELTHGTLKKYFQEQSKNYQNAWGAITMGIVTSDSYPGDMPLHNQILLDEQDPMPFTGASSIFVSMSHPDDNKRCGENERILNISCHTPTGKWFRLNGAYETKKKDIKSYIIRTLKERLPGFYDANLKLAFAATPVTWQNWVHRKKGRVGGIPQSMDRSLVDWPSSKTPFKGLYCCGDTVFPGQGIPGVTLSGINAYKRVINEIKLQ